MTFWDFCDRNPYLAGFLAFLATLLIEEIVTSRARERLARAVMMSKEKKP